MPGRDGHENMWTQTHSHTDTHTDTQTHIFNYLDQTEVWKKVVRNHLRFTVEKIYDKVKITTLLNNTPS